MYNNLVYLNHEVPTPMVSTHMICFIIKAVTHCKVHFIFTLFRFETLPESYWTRRNPKSLPDRRFIPFGRGKTTTNRGPRHYCKRRIIRSHMNISCECVRINT